MEPQIEAINFLIKSENRFSVLSTIDKEPIDTRDLRDETGIPRSTVQRNLNELIDKDWVVRDKGVYRVTPWGSKLVSLTNSYVGDLQMLNDCGPVINEIPSLDEDLFLNDDTINVSSLNTSSPQEPLLHAMNVISQCSSFKLAIPHLSDLDLVIYNSEVENKSGCEEILIPPLAFERLANHYKKEDMVEIVHLVDRGFIYGIIAGNNRGAILQYNQQRQLIRLLETQSNSGIDLCNALFKKLKQDSTE